MDCLDDETVLAFVGRRLDAVAVAAVDEHLNRCASCRKLVAEAAKFVYEPDRPAATATARGAPAVLSSGMTVSRYRIERPLGSGAAGTVYEAYDPQLKRKVALKLVRAPAGSPGQGEPARARLLREAEAMARLSHPNVVGVFDAGIYEDAVFIVMELVEGETLTRWLGRSPKP